MAEELKVQCADGSFTVYPLSQQQKSGNTVTTIAHILTAMVGAGVLAMPFSVGTLGWIGGIAALVFFWGVQMVFSQLLATVYRVNGVYHPRYFEAVAHVLGRKYAIACAVFQITFSFLTDIAFLITATISMQVIANLACGVPQDTNIGQNNRSEGCFNDNWPFVVIFGGAQIVFVQVSSIESSWLPSAMGAATAITYSLIALGLCIAKVADGNHGGTVGGIPNNAANKVFDIFNSLGNLGWAFSFSVILLEIQDSIREPPNSTKTMQAAIRISLGVGLAFYMAIAVFGYLAFGQAVPENIMYGFDSPQWLIYLVNVLVILHMLSAYLLFAQSVFLTLEEKVGSWLGVRRPQEEAAAEFAHTKAAAAASKGEAADTAAAILHAELEAISFTTPDGEEVVGSLAGPFRHSAEIRHWRSHPLYGKAVSVGVRSLYVVVTTVVALVMPFFTAVVGLVGSLTFWPLAVGFPLAMYLKVHEPQGKYRAFLFVLAAAVLVTSLCGMVGSFRNLIVSWSTFSII